MKAATSGGVARTTSEGKRRPLRARSVATGVGALALLAACTTVPDPDPTGTPTTSPTEGPSPSPTPGAGEAVGVYYTLDTRAGIKIAREYRDLGGSDLLVAALEAMIAEPEDPDYSTTWDPDTDVLGVTEEDGAIEVDLSEDARTANVGAETAAQMIQQLVYTVTDAADDEDAEVQLLIEGTPAGELWGAVEWSEPVGRADPLDVRLLVQVDEPREGSRQASPVRVSGDAAAFEATVQWRVLDEDDAEVDSGFTTTTEGQTFAPFEFEVQLDPGEYTIEVSESDPSDGAAGTPMTDTKTITVR